MTSTIDPDLPEQGVPYNAAPIRDNFEAAISDIEALQSLNAGGSSPSVPVLGTWWLDTSAGTTYTLRIWNDRQSQWVPVAALDSLESLWMPPVGGGEPVSLLADDTTDLGSVPQTVITITGGGPIFSFGTSTPAGVIKVLQFNGATTVIYDASTLILPGAADITTAAGDVAIAVALGAGNWQVLFFQSTALIVAQGGTGRTTLTDHAVLIGNDTSPVNFAVPSTSGHALLSTGAGSDPAFGQVSLTVGVTGILPVANGGTGRATLAVHAIPLGNGTTAPTMLVPGTLDYPLVSRGPTLDPHYAVLTTAGGGTGLSTITAHSLIVGNGTGIPTLLPPNAAFGLPLISQGVAADPIYGIARVPGGGTGLATLTAHALIIGNGTATPVLLPPGAGGLPVVSQGAASDPAYASITVAGGGTGVTTVPVGSVLQGNGTAPLFLAAPATADFPLTSNGALAQPTFRAINLAGAGLIGVLPAANLPPMKMGKDFITASTTYTILAKNLRVTLVGGGGGGGGGNPDATNPGGGGGGGAGSTLIYYLNGLTIGNTLALTVGAAGAAGGASAAGGNGGNTSVASGTQIITTGTAGGGVGGATGIGPGTIAGGAGGTTSGGVFGETVPLGGAAGALGFSIPSSVGIPGVGGVAGAGLVGGFYGNGGQGGIADTATGSAGLAGNAGCIFIEWLEYA